MTLEEFIKTVQQNQRVSFEQSMQVIDQYYHFTPISFSNGSGENKIINQAGENAGSCRLFAFAALHELNKQQTLNLFGDYYHLDVIKNPEGNDHANIRTFIQYGWEGVNIDANKALQLRST